MLLQLHVLHVHELHVRLMHQRLLLLLLLLLSRYDGLLSARRYRHHQGMLLVLVLLEHQLSLEHVLLLRVLRLHHLLLHVLCLHQLLLRVLRLRQMRRDHHAARLQLLSMLCVLWLLMHMLLLLPEWQW